MDTVDLIQSIRDYLSADSDLRSHFTGATTKALMLRRVLYKDAQYVSIKNHFDYPFITLMLDETDEETFVPSNKLMLKVSLNNSWKNAACAETNVRIKDRIKELMANKCNTDAKHEEINDQATALGLDIKVRELTWVSAVTYDDKEQGSERLHKIICIIQMTVGD